MIVELAPPPAARAGYGRPGLARRASAALRAIDAAQRRAEARILAAVPGAEVRWRYRIVLDGLAVVVPADAVDDVGALPGIVRVYPSVRYRPLLDRSPGQIGAPAVWGPGLENAGRGIKIGIIDDGIDAGHPFFDPSGFTMPPGFPKGERAYTSAKVIVARAFPPHGSTWPQAARPFDRVYSFHGTHVAGIAAGNAGTVAPEWFGRPRLEGLSGVAPLAYLGNYKALTTPTDSGLGLNGNSPELVAAVEAAVADGMDVINLSLGEPQIDPERDAVARALDNAAAAGVVPVVAAGNDFEELGLGSVGSPGTAARAITVAAVTGDRYFGVDASVVGPEPVPPELASFGGRPGVEGIPERFGSEDQALVDVTALGAEPELCSPLPRGSLAGLLALVRRGRCGAGRKARHVLDAGGAGIVLANAGPGDPPFPSGLGVPVLAVSRATADALAAFAAAAADRRLLVRIGDDPAEVTSEEAGLAAPFSASGPTPLGLEPKPDVSAPGVDVLSSVPEGAFDLFSGTSMAAPHVAGAAALLRELHPGWTVAEVKAALVLTGRPVWLDAAKEEEAPSARQGGGLVDLPEAASPLVFAQPASLGFGLVDAGRGAQTVERLVALSDAGGGAGAWSVRVETRSTDGGTAILVPAEVGVPGTLTVAVSVGPGASEGERTGFVVLERDGERRRLPYWLRVTRPRLPSAPAQALTEDGFYRGDPSRLAAEVDAYRYPDGPSIVRSRLPGPEQVFRVVVERPLANFGVAVVGAGKGVDVEPRIVLGADENRLLGVAALPYVSNPYLPTFFQPVRAAAALLPSPGTYSIVFDTPSERRAGRFRFRFWLDDVTPPSVRLLSLTARGGRLRARVSDAGAGVDPRAVLYSLDGGPARRARLDATRGIVVLDLRGARPGTHRLRLQVSDRQEAKNNENVAAILPNTRVVTATIRIP